MTSVHDIMSPSWRGRNSRMCNPAKGIGNNLDSREVERAAGSRPVRMGGRDEEAAIP